MHGPMNVKIFGIEIFLLITDQYFKQHNK